MRISKLLLASCVALSFAAHAQQDNKSKVEMKDMQEIKKGEDLDAEVTDPRMRATAGSKSKWSVAIDVAYAGGQIDKPFDKARPNPNAYTSPPPVSMGGEIGVRYRLTKNMSLKAGTGFSVVKPFHGAEETEVATPYVAFNRTFSAMGLEQSSTAQFNYATLGEDRDIGEVGTFDLSHTMLGKVGQTRLVLGAVLSAGLTGFDKKNEIVNIGSNSNPAIAYQEDYELGIYPFVQYSLSDRFALRSVFRPWIHRHARGEEGWTFNKAPWTQTIGMNSSITRDVFIYPYLLFQPERISKGWTQFRDNTTVNVSATINVF